MKHELIADGIPFAKGWCHTHGSAAVIGRKSGSAQGSWDDACTASVPTWPRWSPIWKSVTDQRRSQNLN
jgi:hypothetical protein